MISKDMCGLNWARSARSFKNCSSAIFSLIRLEKKAAGLKIAFRGVI